MEVTQTPKNPENIKQVPVEFTGSAKTFFGIWIVNILLSIITLGIYSAWATVRNNQFFYSNTKIDGHAFSYLATGGQIFRGRLLAMFLFIIFVVCQAFFPPLVLVMLLCLLIASPWLIVQSLRFNYRMTSYRNVRFDFKGSYGSAFVTFLLLPLLGLITLYIAMPWVMKKMHEYVLNNTFYGDKPLEAELSTKQYYFTFLTILLSIIFGALAVAGVIFATTGGLNLNSLETISGSLGFVVAVLYLAFICLMNVIYTVQIRNHMFNNSKFKNTAKFESKLEYGSLASLIITNIFALIFSLGFAFPWVAVRSASYMAKHTDVILNTEQVAIMDTASQEQSAFGDEAADVFDVGLSVI